MRKYINKFLIIIINILIIITSGTVWQVRSGVYDIILVYIIIIFLLINFDKLINKIKYLIICIIPILIYLSLGIYVYKGLYINLVVKIILLIIYFTICIKEEKLFIFNNFSKIILIYSFFNLIIYLLLQFNIIEFNNLVYLNSYEKSINKIYYTYSGIFYNWQGNFNIFGFNILRNSGIFVEAGRYGLFLSFSLIIEVLLKRKISIINILILSIATITTVSTTSIILLIIILLTKYVTYNKKSDLLLFVGIPSTFLIAVVSIIAIFKDKLKTNIGSASLLLRIYDMKLALEYFKEKLIWGWGIGNDNLIKSATYYGTTVDGNANGITKLLYQGGVFFTLFYIVLLILLFNFLNRKFGKLISIVILGIFIFQIASQGIIYDSITIFILIFSYVEFWDKIKL